MVERLIEILKVILLGIIEGVSEWLPISSSGHMLLIDEFIKLDMSDNFKEMFFVVIQLGAILAIVAMFFKKIFPFEFKTRVIKKDIISMWGKVVVACIPGAIVTLLFDDYIEKYFHTPIVISLMLIIYGVIFIIVENWNKRRITRVEKISNMSFKTAFIIGLFQVLSIIPGTSRSGATIVGALLIGVSRVVATEFTFFLAIPVMFGFSFLKLVDFGFNFSSNELMLLIIGMLVSFLVSILVVKFLMNYIRKKDFKIFGIYRIILGIIVFSYFIFLS